ncbi:MAG: SdpI family protein [Eggerthellaceae bacterium]
MAVFSLFVFADGLSSSGSPFAALDSTWEEAPPSSRASPSSSAATSCQSDRNEAFGLRTPWSLSNDEVWRKSQRFGGYAMIASGVLTVVAGLHCP